MANTFLIVLAALAHATVAPSDLSARATLRVQPFTTDDYPSAAIMRSATGSTVARALIDPDGKVAHCDITASSGSSDLDQRVCDVILYRARYRPARDHHGAAMFGVESMAVNWLIVGQPAPPSKFADLAFTVKTLPGKAERAMVTIRAIISSSGKIEDCQIDVSSGIAGVDRLACPMAMRQGQMPPIAATDGQAVRTMRGLRVAFVVEAAVPPAR